MKTITAICLALALGGCGLFDDRAAIEAKRAVRAEASCRAIGLDPSGEKWQDCMINMLAADKASTAGSTIFIDQRR